MSSNRGASSGNGPQLSISVVSHGDADGVRRLLGSLDLHETRRDLELILTDNLGSDLPDFDLSGWGSARMIRNPRPLSFARNHNHAHRLSRTRYFCILNPDVVFVMPTLVKLVADLDEGRGDILAPSVVNAGGLLQDSFRDLPSPMALVRRRLLRQNTFPAPIPGQFLHPDWIAGIFMVTRTDTFGALGGFDERYRLYFEDVDLCTRARLAGLKIAVDGALRVQHDARHASRRLGLPLIQHLRSAMLFFVSRPYWDARRLKGAHG